MEKVGVIPSKGVVRPDASNGRVHFLELGVIFTYHHTEFTSLGWFADRALENRTRLIRWSSDGLAAGGGSTAVLLRGKLVTP
jgi:hypothetical protein